MTKNEHNYLRETFDYFRGAFEMIDDDLPDGAWFQMHVDIAEDSFEFIKNEFGLIKPKGLDGYDVTHYYLENKKQ